MRFLVIGAGSIGYRHIKNLLYLKQKVAGCEPGRLKRYRLSAEFDIRTYRDLNTALKDERYDAAVIANPTAYHIPSAIKVAERGLHLFIEKPLSHNLNNVNRLIGLVRRKRLKTFIGSNWKFHPRFKLLKKLLDENAAGRILAFNSISGCYLPSLRQKEDYRKVYSARKTLGGGVILDTHQFDYIQWFLGPIEKIACFSGKYSKLCIDTEDIAEIIVGLKAKMVGTIHIDYIQRPGSRIYYFYGEDGCIKYSDQKKSLSVYSVKTKRWRHFNEKKGYDKNQMFIDEMRHFIDVLKGKENSITDIYNAERSLKIALAAKDSAARGRAVYIS